MAASRTDTWRQNIGPHARWYHRTTELEATIEGANYFDAFADEMEVGDVIECSIDIDGTPLGNHYVVSTITAGAVALTQFNVA